MKKLTPDQLTHFEEEGYLLLKGLLDPQTDLQPVTQEYTDVLDRLAGELYENGEIASTYDHLPFGKRLMKVYQDSGLYVRDEHLELDNVLTCPMSPGDVLFLHRRTCHSSLPNKSDNVRVSLDLRYNPTGQSTGRDVFPGFVARSRAHPETELHDPKAWAQLWYDARSRLAVHNIPSYNRWRTDDPACA